MRKAERTGSIVEGAATLIFDLFKRKYGLLTAFPKMDIRSAHEPSMIRKALFLSERESVFPAPACP
ncbi:hypothetical protein, partial [Salmonella sp. SAL4359]|uniref:hypothetical protein n=1 Tax=Salmonella sp. SAL4359 TaxID=3159880 RepID=UPI00397DFF1F